MRLIRATNVFAATAESTKKISKTSCNSKECFFPQKSQSKKKEISHFSSSLSPASLAKSHEDLSQKAGRFAVAGLQRPFCSEEVKHVQKSWWPLATRFSCRQLSALWPV